MRHTAASGWDRRNRTHAMTIMPMITSTNGAPRIRIKIPAASPVTKKSPRGVRDGSRGGTERTNVVALASAMMGSAR